jgi:NAD-dependent dihydropyrimidine dehydrogenase PreA subunit
MYALKINYGPRIDYGYCNGCKVCYENCPMDVFGWDEEKRMPITSYPGECAFCCFCEIICPEVAIDVYIPLHHLLDFGISPVAVKPGRKFLGKD